MLEAGASHRDHAVIEQVIAYLKNGSLAHLPPGKSNATGAWVVLATVAVNLTPAAGSLASGHHAKARTKTRRSALSSSRSRPGSRPPPGITPCTYRRGGPGRQRS